MKNIINNNETTINNKVVLKLSSYTMDYIYQIITILVSFFTSFFYNREKTNTNTTNNNIIIKTPTDMYTEKHLAVFLNSFDADSLDKNNEKNWNSNIDPVFYSKEKYVELLKHEDNALEIEWKKRILIEYTPRGNVFMFYDPYKLGFSYYCDQYVPHNILNAVAMKYVLKFQCRDFFMDEHVVPENSASPLLKLVIEEKKVKENQDKLDSNIKNRLRNAPLAKFKNYNRALSTINEDTKKEGSQNVPPEKTEKQKEINRFINLGKTMNFSMLQPVMKKKRGGGGGTGGAGGAGGAGSTLFKSMLASSLFENSSVQKEVFSYRDFKNAGNQWFPRTPLPLQETKVSPHAPSFYKVLSKLSF